VDRFERRTPQRRAAKRDARPGRREHKRAARQQVPTLLSERPGGNKNNKKETNNAQNLRERSDWQRHIRNRRDGG